MEVSLLARSRSLPFLVLIVSASLLLAIETVLLAVASSVETPGQGRWLLALDSANPQLQHRLGQLYRGGDPARGAEYLRRATELSSYSRRYWEDLASACESAGDTPCADRAEERLLQLCPMVPLYHWDAAQRALRQQRRDEAVAEFRRLLEFDPSSYTIGIWDALRAVQPPEVTFQEIFGNRADAKLEMGYIDFLSAQGDDAGAYRIWKLAVANAGSFPFAFASRYLERLIGLGRTDEAASVWQDLDRLAIVPRPQADEKPNLVFNGDFEQFPLNAGFDWRAGRIAYLAVDFSAPGAYHGAHCLRVDFAVSRNDEYEPVFQFVPVLPNHTYRLQAYVRSQEITSDTGPCLRVRDTQAAGFAEALSEATVGTTPWHPVRLSFTTGAKTRALELSIWRPRGRVFPTEISGTFWLDAVSLEELDSAAAPDTAHGQH